MPGNAFPAPIPGREGFPGMEQAQELRLDTLLANLPGMAYRCCCRRDWTMLFVSEGCQSLTGYTAAELLGSAPPTYADLIHPEDRKLVWGSVQESLAQGRHFEIEYRIITRGGRVKWVWERGVRVPDGPDGESLLEGFICDFSERRQQEADLAERGEHLEGELNSKVRELRIMVKAMAGREVRMAGLKRENQRLRDLLRGAGLDPGGEEAPA
ncbi:MAG: PAS domain-containing protein [Lentisphaeria bacterium]|nr:PAS domain-containing protein [Lentisphaeria bacterium]